VIYGITLVAGSLVNVDAPELNGSHPGLPGGRGVDVLDSLLTQNGPVAAGPIWVLRQPFRNMLARLTPTRG
jgi:hypothetical protein